MLFDRLPRGVALTEEGRCLLAHVEAVLDRLVTAERDLEAMRTLGRGRLRVGAFPTAVAALVPRALAAFRAEHPGVALSLVEGRTPALLERLLGRRRRRRRGQRATGPADRRVALRPAPPARRAAAGRGPAQPTGWPAAACVRLTELADDSFIAGSATAEETLLRATLPAGFQPKIDIVAAEWTGKLGCVAAGLGVALVPALAARATPADLVLLRLHRDDASVRQVFAATVAGRSRPPAVTRLFAELVRVARTL